MNLEQLCALIHDAEGRIGSFVACGGSSEDPYVKQQIHKIQFWDELLAKLLIQESN